MSDINRQLEDLQNKILDLQHELPDSPFQMELQRLQRELANLKDSAPAVKPAITLINPTPPAPPLNSNELAVWGTFTDYHKALLQYCGGGQYMPRGEWLHLADCATDMTGAYAAGGGSMIPAPPPPSSPGLYAWDAVSQTWKLAFTGRTDGTSPAAGMIGEYVSATTTGFPPTGINVPIASPTGITPAAYVTLAQTNLTAGDWDVWGWAEWDTRSVSGVTGTYLTGWVSFTTPTATTDTIYAGSKYWLPPTAGQQAGPMPVERVSLTAPQTLYLVTVVQSQNPAADVGKNVPSAGAIIARRVS